MMAAEAGNEEGGPVTAGAGGGGAAAGSSAYPAVCRVKIPAALPVTAVPYPGLAEAGVAGTLGGGAALASGFLGVGSVAGVLGGAGLTGGGAVAGVAGAAAAAAGPGGDMALTRGIPSLPAETLGPGGGFPPLPPPPPFPSLGAGLGTVDEGDSLDGPEYEEEEVAIPLTAPPTNQHAPWRLRVFIAPLGRCKVFKMGSLGKCVFSENRIWFYPFQIQVVDWDSAEIAATKAVIVCISLRMCSLLKLDD